MHFNLLFSGALLSFAAVLPVRAISVSPCVSNCLQQAATQANCQNFNLADDQSAINCYCSSSTMIRAQALACARACPWQELLSAAGELRKYQNAACGAAAPAGGDNSTAPSSSSTSSSSPSAASSGPQSSETSTSSPAAAPPPPSGPPPAAPTAFEGPGTNETDPTVMSTEAGATPATEAPSSSASTLQATVFALVAVAAVFVNL